MSILPSDIKNLIFSNTDSNNTTSASSALGITNEAIINEIKTIDPSFSIRTHLLSLLNEYRERKSLAYKLYEILKDKKDVWINTHLRNNTYILIITVRDEDFKNIISIMSIPVYKTIPGETGYTVIKEGEIYAYNDYTIYAVNVIPRRFNIEIECKDLSLTNQLLRYLSLEQKEYYYMYNSPNTNNGLYSKQYLESYNDGFEYSK